jgi:hypothetical protein
MQALAVAKAAAKTDERKSDKQQETKHRRTVMIEYQNCTFGSFCNL